MQRNPRQGRRGLLLVVLAVFVTLPLLSALVGARGGPAIRPTYSRLLSDIDAGRVASAKLETATQKLTVGLRDGSTYATGVPESGEDRLLEALRRHGVNDVVVETIPGAHRWSGCSACSFPSSC